MSFIDILNIILACLIMVVIGLAIAYIYILYKNKNTEGNNTNNEKKDKNQVDKKGNTYTKIPVFDFMQFDKIEDNMIVQDNDSRYLMVIECEGVNYDLMSNMEKASVEAGFVQFLNSLRHTIQIYTQTRTVNIEESIMNYRTKIEELSKALESKQRKYTSMVQEGIATQKQLDDAKRELARLQNLYDYGVDVVENIEKTSQNKNVLRKHYYIIVPYYSSEIDNDMLDPEEKRNMIFAELYTRAQSIIRTLFACSMKCRILNSYELADLLYVAYNRDESEVYGFDKALRAGYNELYSTGQDIIDKKMAALDEKIEQDALKLAIEKIEEVKSDKEKKLEKKEKSFGELVKEMAKQMLQENQTVLGHDIAKEAINKIDDTQEEGGEENEKKTIKRTR
ncbi:MAG: hypothetical protein J6A29_01000 [Clostridia bacterium]|nr:hypothetical protein [Clostridia bacterium]